MLNVLDGYKLINLEIDGEERALRINTSEAWNVLEVEVNGKTIVVNEGDTISFIVESGEVVEGTVTKLKGKNEKAKIQIAPLGQFKEEIWDVLSIKENSLKVINSKDGYEEYDEEE